MYKIAEGKEDWLFVLVPLAHAKQSEGVELLATILCVETDNPEMQDVRDVAWQIDGEHAHTCTQHTQV